MSEYTGKYLGSLQIKDSSIADQKTRQGNAIILVTMEDGSSFTMTKLALDETVTEKKTDPSALRDIFAAHIASTIMDQLWEYGMPISYWDVVSSIINQTIDKYFEIAENKMWGTDRKTLLDLDMVLKGGVLK